MGPGEWAHFWKLATLAPGPSSVLAIALFLAGLGVAWWALKARVGNLMSQVDAARERSSLAQERARAFKEDSERLREQIKNQYPQLLTNLPPSPKRIESGDITFIDPGPQKIIFGEFPWPPNVQLEGSGKEGVEVTDVTTSTATLNLESKKQGSVTFKWIVSE